MNEVVLHSTSNGQARTLAASGAPVYLFVNPVEYHGPHLSLDNDALVSRGLARDVHARLAAVHPDWPYLTAGELGMGCGAVHGPGSRPTPYPRLRDQVVDACRSLATLGVRRVILMTFHGDPMHNVALQAGADWLAGEGIAALVPMHLLIRELVSQKPGGGRLAPILDAVPDAAERRILADGLYRDIHAGFGETSLTLHYAPESVSPTYRDVPPCPDWRPYPAVDLLAQAARLAGVDDFAAEAAYAALGLGWLALRPFPGYTGHPGLARPEVGAVLSRLIADSFAEAALDVFDRGAPAPRPVLAWLETLTAGGRVY